MSIFRILRISVFIFFFRDFILTQVSEVSQPADFLKKLIENV